MKRIRILLLASLMLLSACGSEKTAETVAEAAEVPVETVAETEEETVIETEAETEPAEEAPAPELLFEDTFDGTELDSSKWERCPEWDRQGGLDVWDNDMSYLDGEGHLVLRAEWNADEKKIHSGAVRTYGKFTEDFAYYEASIKFAPVHGIWGAFWMMVGSVGSEQNGASDGVEIDIIESINGDRNICNSALHWDGYGAAHQKVGYDIPKHDIYDGEFHTFGLWRTEEAYVFYIDGEETWRVTSDQCDICPEQGYMKLTVEGADWAGAGTKKSIESLPADMIVDYVRVYSEKPE